MLCLMHEGTPYGYLKVNNKVILPPNLSRMVGATLQEIEGWLSELLDAGVYSIEDGCIFSRRMVKDEEIRLKRAAGGHLGGNPALINTENKVDGRLTTEVKQNTTPASASSSALKNKNISAISFPDFWALWPSTDRKTQKAKCLEKWKTHNLDSKAQVILAHVAALKLTEKWRNGFEPAPMTYLNGKQWEDGIPEIKRQSEKDETDPVYLELVAKYGAGVKRRESGGFIVGGRIYNADGTGGASL